MYPHHVFNLEPAGTFRIYPICYWWVSGGYLQPELVMYSRCFHWFPGPLTPSAYYIHCTIYNPQFPLKLRSHPSLVPHVLPRSLPSVHPQVLTSSHLVFKKRTAVPGELGFMHPQIRSYGWIKQFVVYRLSSLITESLSPSTLPLARINTAPR